MRQAIITKFISPTNTKGARVKAKCEAGSITLEWDYALNGAQNHTTAAETLKAKLGWTGRLIGGGFEGQYFFVFAE
jgi:hypothetical protein